MLDGAIRLNNVTKAKTMPVDARTITWERTAASSRLVLRIPVSSI